MNQLLADLMTDYVDSDGEDLIEPQSQASHSPNNKKQMAMILAESVTDELKQHLEWAESVIQASQLRWPGGLLQERMAHYPAEKRYLAKCFSEWLSLRIQFWLKIGKYRDRPGNASNVYLLVDAGSTNLWFCHYLWPHLSQIARLLADERPAREPKHRFAIVTNNVPVIEAFAEQKQQGQLTDKAHIECHLVGGRVDPWYGALVGDIACSNLGTYTNKGLAPGKYISLSAGNFISLTPRRASMRPMPIPLVRGEGQKDVKELYFTKADEVYVVAPLGKVFVRDVRDLNHAFGLEKNDGEHEKQPYEEVLADGRQSYVKLVTTLREWEGALLTRHSNAVEQALHMNHTGISEPTEDINDIHHFCYPYDRHIKGKSRRLQAAIELPHARTRSDEFMHYFYGIPRPNNTDA